MRDMLATDMDPVSPIQASLRRQQHQNPPQRRVGWFPCSPRDSFRELDRGEKDPGGTVLRFSGMVGVPLTGTGGSFSKGCTADGSWDVLP